MSRSKPMYGTIEVVNADPALWAAGVAIALAVPLTFMVANWVRKNIDHGEARFDTRNANEDEDKQG